jgi:hypothetical protein
MPLVALLLAGLVAFIAVVIATPALYDLADLLWLKLEVLLGLDP